MDKVKKMSLRLTTARTKFLLITVFLALVLNIQSARSTVITIVEEGYTTIGVLEAKNKIDTEPDLFILDVRRSGEFILGHIPGAVHIPYTDITTRQDELPTNKSHPILVYCKSGGRSQTASATLVLLSYSQVFNMEGGFDAWKDAHYPYETGAYIIQTNSNITSTSSTIDSLTSPAVSVLFVFQAICFMVILAKRR